MKPMKIIMYFIIFCCISASGVVAGGAKSLVWTSIKPTTTNGSTLNQWPRNGTLEREAEEHVRSGQVANPQETVRVPQREAGVERLPEPDEDRQLDQGRQAAGDRVDSVLLVKGEGLLGQPFLVVLVLLLKLLQVRLKLLHLLGGERLLAADREHEPADQERQQDDRDAVVPLRPAEEAGDPLGHLVGEAQGRRDHELGDLGRERDPLVLAVDGQPLGMIGLERVDRLGTGEDPVGVRDRLVRADLDRPAT